jgi:hypothetical protein
MKLFLSYARENIDDLRALLPYLQGTDGVTSIFWDEHLRAGDVWKQKLKVELLSSDILIFLLSPYSIISEMCLWEFQTFQAHKKRIIPIYLESVDHSDTSRFSKLNGLPLDTKRNLKPVDRWAKPNTAYQAIARELKKVIRELRRQQQELIEEAREKSTDQLSDFEQVLERYLSIFGSSLTESELDPYEFKGHTFSYYSREWNVAFEPMKDVGDLEVTRLRFNDFIQPFENADFRIFFIPYNVEEETRDARELLNKGEAPLEAISRHIDELESTLKAHEKSHFMHIPRIDEIYLSEF